MKIQNQLNGPKNQGDPPLLLLFEIASAAKCHRRERDGTAVDM